MSDDSKKSDIARSARAVAKIGSSSVVNIAFGVLKIKIAALILGTNGIAIIGLMQQVVGNVSTFMSVGVRTSGTKEISEKIECNNEMELKLTQKSIIIGASFLSIMGGGLFVLFQNSINKIFFSGQLSEWEMYLLAISIVLTVITNGQLSIINGYKKINNLAIITALTGMCSALMSVLGIWLIGKDAVILFVFSSPLFTYLISNYFIRKIDIVADFSKLKFSFIDISKSFKKTLKLGVSIMLASVVVTAGHLMVRYLVKEETSLHDLGLFTSAWMLSQYYIGFLYAALTADYYPSLVANISNAKPVNKIINTQIEVSFIFSGTLFLIMMAGGGVFIELMYSSEFSEAFNVLKWLVLGDIIKTACHPLTTAYLAYSKGYGYFSVRLYSIIIFVLACIFLLPTVGVEGGGIAYLIMYLCYFPVIYLIVKKKSGWSMSSRNKIIFFILFILSSMILVFSLYNNIYSIYFGAGLALLWGYYSVRKLSEMTGVNNKILRITKILKFK